METGQSCGFARFTVKALTSGLQGGASFFQKLFGFSLGKRDQAVSKATISRSRRNKSENPAGRERIIPTATDFGGSDGTIFS
jgi:hypothetical protein